MKKHSLSYFDLNPKPSAKGLLLEGFKALALALYAVAFVYLSTVILFSF